MIRPGGKEGWVLLDICYVGVCGPKGYGMVSVR